MADFPGSAWAGWTLVDLVDFFTAARANAIADEVVALEDYLITTTRADSTVLAGPASGGPTIPTWRTLLGADIPQATTTTRGTIEFATDAEVATGSDTGRCVTPAGLRFDQPLVPAVLKGVRLDANGDLIMPDNGRIDFVELASSERNNLTAYSVTTADSWRVGFRKSHQDTAGNAATINTEALGEISWWGNSGAAFTQGAIVKAVQNGAAGVNTPTDLHFLTSDGSGAPATKMILDKDGNIAVTNASSIGIGAALERVEFYTVGLVAILGAQAAIGATAINTNMDLGITLDQGAFSSEVINARSSTVGAVRNTVETGTYMTVKKFQGSGGARLDAFKDSTGLNYGAFLIIAHLEENVDVVKTTAGRAISEIISYQTTGTVLENTVADGNVFALRTQRGGADVTVLLVDEGADMDLPSGRIATGYGDYWDLEDYHAGAPTADGYVQVDINGTTYQLLANLP